MKTVLRQIGVVTATAAGWLGVSSTVVTPTVELRRSSGGFTTAGLYETAGLNDLLGLVALLAAWLLLTWLALGVVLSAVTITSHTVGRTVARFTDRLTPALVRRCVAALVGGAVLMSPVASAQTASAVTGKVTGTGTGAVTGAVATPTSDPVPAATHVTPEGAVVFDRPQASVRASARDTDRDVVVHRGDTLWDIAAHHLGADASPAAIAAEWPRWHAANREVIGTNPDLIRPGQVLVPPTPEE